MREGGGRNKEQEEGQMEREREKDREREREPGKIRKTLSKHSGENMALTSDFSL